MLYVSDFDDMASLMRDKKPGNVVTLRLYEGNTMPPDSGVIAAGLEFYGVSAHVKIYPDRNPVELEITKQELIMPVSVYLGESNEGSVSWIPKNEKNPHLLVVGTSGSGKTVTLRSLVYELGKSGIPSLIVDFHNDFDDLAESILDFKNITINPLDFSGGETAETSMYKVSSILSKIFRLGVQQEGVLQDAIIESYGKYGIGLKDTMHDGAIPDFNTVRRALEEKIDVLREERRATVTVETLMVRLRPLFDTGFFSQKETKKFDEIFMKTTVLKLRDLPTDEVKYTVAEFFLNKLKYALYKKGKTDELRLYCIVDEAHRLIDERSPLNDLLRESRKYGTGVIMSFQPQ